MCKEYNKDVQEVSEQSKRSERFERNKYICLEVRLIFVTAFC